MRAEGRCRGDRAALRAGHRRALEYGPLRGDALQLQEELARALLDPLREALEVAIANVRAVAQAALDADQDVPLPQGQTVTVREIPVSRAAIYVPGGRAPYPSRRS